MTDSTDEQALRAELAEQYRQLGVAGLNELSSGNVSIRIDDDMLISPSGASAENIEPDVVVRMSLDGEWHGERKPSSEWRMHAAIYKNTRASAVVHTHSDYCVALSCQGQDLPGFHYLVGTFGGSDVPCTTYKTFGSEELAESAAQALQKRTACLLGSHGMICRGRNLGQAVMLAHRLEIMCRQYVLTRQQGEPYLLTDAEWADFFDRAKKISYGKFI
ncbi:MAG: class II aldolase/adducin family protein [Pseudomonadales bacterium]|nr:class II aldolase/adducin family protein [Pseudomonadales bacterium]